MRRPSSLVNIRYANLDRTRALIKSQNLCVFELADILRVSKVCAQTYANDLVALGEIKKVGTGRSATKMATARYAIFGHVKDKAPEFWPEVVETMDTPKPEVLPIKRNPAGWLIPQHWPVLAAFFGMQ